MDKCLADIRAFADRELRPYEETRRSIAEWHAKYLFQPQLSASSTLPDKCTRVRSILCDASRILESLAETSGVQSFLLAVDPHDPADAGFLGGSVSGREFWRGLRGGGESGAKSFKLYCQSHTTFNSGDTQDQYPPPPPLPQASTSKAPPARSLKAELYDHVRKALRTASGIRNAEMKWTNHERLDVYGVRLAGWPTSVPVQNPSTLKVTQNKLLLDALQNGTMKFERILSVVGPSQSHEGITTLPEADDNEDFSWAYDADADAPSNCSVTENENSVWPVNESVYESQVNLSSTWQSDYAERPKKRARSTEGGTDEGHEGDRKSVV